jgi:hypothetical protein
MLCGEQAHVLNLNTGVPAPSKMWRVDWVGTGRKRTNNSPHWKRPD